MAGTDSSAEGGAPESRGGSGLDPRAPAVILVRPQLGENIGAAARAMLNCGLSDLRLVAPRDPWPNRHARAAASGADRVLDAARLFSTAEEAVADLGHVYATTARRRDMVKPVVTPRQAARELRAAEAREERCGLLFGPERTGLENDEVVLAQSLVVVPLNPGFSSLNLAQAVLLLGYEWFQSGDESAPRELPLAGAEPASGKALLALFEHLEGELDATRFLYPPEKRPAMVRNLRNLLQRAQLTDREVQTLRGVIRALSQRRNPTPEP